MASDPRLDRLVSFDERSRNFPVKAVLATPEPASWTWTCNVFLDQGQEGACSGFSVAQEIAAKPAVSPVSDLLAQLIYLRARELDEWPGEDYEGSSVLGAIKAATELGYFKEYRWAFGARDLALAVGKGGTGPAVLGINWYEGMLNTDQTGFVHAVGELVGGHAILCNGVRIVKKGNLVDTSRSWFRLHNSWGPSWGEKGEAKILWDDLSRLLREQGEACTPISRLRKAA